MPSNKIVINGNEVYEVPDSFMAPLEAYLNMVKGKTIGIMFDDHDDDDAAPESRQKVSESSGPREDTIPVQNDSFAQKLANESLHMVSILRDKLEPVLLPDDGTTPDAREASPLLETQQAIHGHLEKLVKRVDLW